MPLREPAVLELHSFSSTRCQGSHARDHGDQVLTLASAAYGRLQVLQSLAPVQQRMHDNTRVISLVVAAATLRRPPNGCADRQGSIGMAADGCGGESPGPAPSLRMRVIEHRHRVAAVAADRVYRRRHGAGQPRVLHPTASPASDIDIARAFSLARKVNAIRSARSATSVSPPGFRPRNPMWAQDGRKSGRACIRPVRRRRSRVARSASDRRPADTG
jgi:hypothetical protein